MNPKPRITAPFGLPVTYAKSSCIFEGMIVMVLYIFPSKTVIKKKKCYSSIVSTLEWLFPLSFNFFFLIVQKRTFATFAWCSLAHVLRFLPCSDSVLHGTPHRIVFLGSHNPAGHLLFHTFMVNNEERTQLFKYQGRNGAVTRGP